MKNKNVGFLIIGISVIIGIIVYLFNKELMATTSSACSMGPECPMYGAIAIQTWVSLALAGLVFIIGLFLILAKEHEKIVIKKIKPVAEIQPKKFSKKSLEKLNKEEAKIMNLLLEHKGSMFQSEIVGKIGFSKVKITRTLDSLEGQGLVERRRRGMTNIVLLKS